MQSDEDKPTWNIEGPWFEIEGNGEMPFVDGDFFQHELRITEQKIAQSDEIDFRRAGWDW